MKKGPPPHSVVRHYAGDRDAVRKQSVIAALEGVLALLESPDFQAQVSENEEEFRLRTPRCLMP